MTSYAKEMIAKGYTKVKVGELQPGDVIFSTAFGPTEGYQDRVVAEVFNSRKSVKTVRFTDNNSYTYGNATKVWKKN